MPNYFYFDANGKKQGPCNEQQLQTLASMGHITPTTPLETDSGHKGVAGQIRGLKFNTAEPSAEDGSFAVSNFVNVRMLLIIAVVVIIPVVGWIAWNYLIPFKPYVVEIRQEGSSVGKAILSRDGKRVVAISRDISNNGSRSDEYIQVWDARSGKELHKLQLRSDESFGGLTEDGKKYITERGDTVRIWTIP